MNERPLTRVNPLDFVVRRRWTWLGPRWFVEDSHNWRSRPYLFRDNAELVRVSHAQFQVALNRVTKSGKMRK